MYDKFFCLILVFPADVHRHGGLPCGQTVPEAQDQSGLGVKKYINMVVFLVGKQF
jgi:hypothetical protein